MLGLRALLFACAVMSSSASAQAPAEPAARVLNRPSLEALQRAFGADSAPSPPAPMPEGGPAPRKPRLRSIVVETDAPPAAPRTVAIALPFQINSAELSTEAVGVLDPLATVLREVTQQSRVIIEGHTDASGAAELNRRLSLARAQAVLRALVSREVSVDRLLVEGHGADRLLADRAPADPTHRRVQFRVEALP